MLAFDISGVHVTPPDFVTFVIATAIIAVGAFGVVLMANPVHAALSLVMTLFGVAVLFIELQADFLAAVQIIVYAGAIVVLFLFVIMFLGVDRRENIEAEPLRGQRPMAFVLVVVGLGGIIALIANSHWVTGAHSVVGPVRRTDVGSIGRAVFTTYLFGFEATAALLVIAVVGAVVLARRPATPATGDEDEDEDEETVVEGPGAPVADGPAPVADGSAPVRPSPWPQPEEVGR